MHMKLSPFTRAPEPRAGDAARRVTVGGKSCQLSTPCDRESVAHRSQFVALAFDRPQTVFHLSQWRWPVIGPYNGFSGAARIRGWQLIQFYRANGWLTHDDVCSVTGAPGETQLHNEDYVRPWDAYPVSKRTHILIHTRARFAKAWAAFLANDALPDTWAKTLSTTDAGFATANRNCSVAQLLEHAPHPAWVDVPEKEFDRR